MATTDWSAEQGTGVRYKVSALAELPSASATIMPADADVALFYSLAIDHVSCAPDQIEQSRMPIAAAAQVTVALTGAHVRVGHVRSGSSVLALLKRAWIGFHQEPSKHRVVA